MEDPRAWRSVAKPGTGVFHRGRTSFCVRWFHFRGMMAGGSRSAKVLMLQLDQFMNIRCLHKQGHSVREIARLTGHSRNTVRKLLRATRAPTPALRVRSSKLDPFKSYITQRWEEHGLSAVRLLPEIRAQGFVGSAQIVRRFLHDLKTTRLPDPTLTVRFETPPGEQAQCDWAEIGRYPEPVPKEA